MNALAAAGQDNQSASEIPEGGEVIPCSLLLRCNRESGCRQGLGRLKAISRSSHPLNGYDFLYGGIGRDILYGSQGNDYIDGESDEDFLDGGSGNDFLFGGLGNDFIDGGLNNDYLDGGDSNDTLTGGIGQDILLGGTGRDSFVFNEFGMSNRDIIKDFDVLSDTIILGNSLDNGLTRFINPGIKGLMFRGGNFSNNQLDSSKFFKGSGCSGAAVGNLSGIYVDTSSGDIWYNDTSLAGSYLIANVGLFAAVAMTSADFIYGG